MKQVSLIIQTYHPDSKRYLDLCIDSIKRLNFPKDKLEVILVARKDYAPEFDGVKTVTPDKEHYSPAHGLNFGVTQSNPNSEVLMFLNDDTILSKHSLFNMVQALGDQRLMLNPISPCDNYVSYCLHFGFPKDGQFLSLVEKHYRYEQLKPFFEDLMNAQSVYPQGLINQDFLCMFATMISRKHFEEIGPFDENFHCGQDDIDYSKRAVEKGLRLAACLDAVIWHFGGVTVDQTLSVEQRKANARYFKQKWNQLPVFVTEEFIR